MNDHSPYKDITSEDLAAGDARRRRIRTRFQAFVSACSVLLVAVPVAMEQIEGNVPPNVYAYLAAGAGGTVAVASVVTRVMNTPVVADFIDAHIPWLSRS
ncbi:hypothetical protein [Salinispora pacifica]|uniref:hypothetical protein n=1 Tax=Salinispora pacifica TaxID=351187 RepID=UPI0003699537|nr:hypothetical protein [Salinispora pacifica]